MVFRIFVDNWLLTTPVRLDIFTQHTKRRDVKDSFVHDMMQSMLKDLDNDTMVCLTAGGEPIIDNNGDLNEEASFFVLGGTHYM